MEHLIHYAMSFVGTPYVYGGNSPLAGLDCSGYVLELLRSVGLWDKTDATAQDIFNKMEKAHSHVPFMREGCLVFFGKSVTQISHIAFAIDAHRFLEAGGGDSTTTSLERAVAKNAFVRMRHRKSRSDIVAVLKLDLSTIGLV